MGRRVGRSAGFTVLELLMVVTLLTILAVTLIPQFTAAHEDARRTAVENDVAQISRLIQNYRDQHSGHWPAERSESESTFQQQLCGRTTATGVVKPDGKYGPYLIGSIPVNPFNQSNRVRVLNSPIEPHHHDGHGAHGWVYSSTTGEFLPNIKRAE